MARPKASMTGNEAKQKLLEILDHVDDLMALIDDGVDPTDAAAVIEQRRAFLAGLNSIEAVTRFLRHGIIKMSRNAGFGMRVDGSLDLRFDANRELVASGVDEHDAAHSNGTGIPPAPGYTRNGTPDLRYSKPEKT